MRDENNKECLRILKAAVKFLEFPQNYEETYKNSVSGKLVSLRRIEPVTS
jgi:hypothetical protein